MPTIYIDDQEYEVKEGENLLEACLNAGLDLPYFCWHPAMGSIGSCRQCAVIQYQNEQDTRGRIVMGCMTPVSEGARFSLNAESATEFREAIIESLMLNHPHDCPVCAEGGECHLQDMTVMVGHRDRRYRGRKNTHCNQYLGPLIHHEMNRCITCYRCVRFYRDYADGDDLAAMASHDHVYFGRHRDGVLSNEFSGNLVEVCPTGVFTDKTLLKQYTRKWDLQSAPSLCTGCAVGCNTSPGERYGKLKRVQNRYNHEVNSYFLCDRGRFGSGYVNNDNRLDYAGLQDADGTFVALSQDKAIAKAAEWIKSSRTAAIGSPRASLEANFLLRELVGIENFASGFATAEEDVVLRIAEILQSTSVVNPSIRQMESADAILILGEDVTNTAPRVALGLRQAVRNKAYELANDARLLHWQDAAVRNLAQEQRSPMIIVSATETRLDDVASELISLPPDRIAEFGWAIARSLEGEKGNDEQADQIAEILQGAKRPLVISGSSLLHQGIVSSASAVAEALQRQGAGLEKEPMLSYCLPECNTMGLALLGGNSLADLVDKAEEIDTLIVLENDLNRRLTDNDLDKLLGAYDVIVLDLYEDSVTDHCDLVLPVASYAESEGTLVSSEGRAQRYFPVFEAAYERLPSWQWLLKLSKAVGKRELEHLHHFDEVVAACAQSTAIFADITHAAPDHDYRDRGLKVPRQTHRYSGRTAMNADVSVHEPQQPVDQETPLAYTMEGLNISQPASLKPFFWSPGWNSNQSVQKFQQEVGGALSGGPNGVRLIEPKAAGNAACEESVDSVELESHKWQLVPMYKMHGSEELSAMCDEIAELAGEGFIALGPVVAEHHGVCDGDGVVVSDGNTVLTLEVRVLSRIGKNCVGFSAGFASTRQLVSGSFVTLVKDENWQRREPQLIATDQGGSRV